MSKNITSEFWNERYRQKEFVYGKTPNQYLKEKLDELPVGKILLPADGEGRNGVYAATLGWDTFSFDPSTESQQKAKELAYHNQVEIDYQVTNVEQAQYPANYFDVLSLIYAHFSQDRRALHQKLATFLKKDSFLILEAFNKQQIKNQEEHPHAGGPKDPLMLYDLQSVKEDFEGFEFLEAENQTIHLNEGKYHNGPGDVIRIFAQKKIN